MATSRKVLSRKGTRASRPHAMVDLFPDVRHSPRNMRTIRFGLLVSTEAVGGVEVLDTLHALLMERASIGGGVEVEVA